jgi:hypothetical protein
MLVTGKKDSFLDFLRELVIVMLETHGKPAAPCGPKRPSLSSTRFDGMNHWIVGTEKDKNGKPSRRNCKQCHLEGKKEMKTVNVCEKCDAPLHTACFKEGFGFIVNFWLGRINAPPQTFIFFTFLALAILSLHFSILINHFSLLNPMLIFIGVKKSYYSTSQRSLYIWWDMSTNINF